MAEPGTEPAEQKPELVETELKGARGWLLLIGAVALLSLIAGNFNGPHPDTETLSPAGLNGLALTARGANVTISQGSSAHITVTMNAPGSAVRLLNVDRRGDNLEISTRRRIWPFTLQPFGRIELDVTLPAGFTPELSLDGSAGNAQLSGLRLRALDVTVSSGDIEINDTRVSGAASLQSRSGHLRMRDSTVGALLRVETRSGSVNLTGTDAASYALYGRSGNVSAEGLPGNELTADVRSGRLSLTADSLLGDWQLSARSGNISVSFGQLPRDVQLDYQGRSGSWSVAEHYGLNLSSEGRNQVSSGSGSGPRLSVETRSGSFRLD